MSRPRSIRSAASASVAVAAVTLLLAPAAAAQTPCDDLLVTHRPEGSSGDTTAVTVTSQTLERTSSGWSSVAWDVAPTVDVRTVVIDTEAGRQELPAGQRSVTGGIEALHVCGADGAAATSSGPHDAAPVLVRAASDHVRGGATLGRPLLGAAIGAAIGAVVLLLSRSARRAEVTP